ncbi:Hypothetical protein NCS54_00974100 [Fusarium falciforme]|uniref:Hypothetical protein n=1 Tax=Fusarium falciforme TaxID=195108 RepID=UPI002301D233|nr:Hypothetical protein NCS54_00974100 [Fusarium falciforme]WAO92242.1 Hypothetical protein NCS54_00974100 [Fusarium falciforme]
MAILTKFIFDKAATISLAVLLPACIVGLVSVHFLYTVLYQLFFNPLRKFPGPKLWAVSIIPYVRMHLQGQSHQRILKLHQKYGPIVRIGPNFLSFNHPDAMKEIRGHRKTGTGENSKEPLAATPNADNIIGANRPDHQRFRRALANGFSARTMQEQEPIIKSYVDSFIQVLHEECADGKEPVNVEQWLNFLTFDIVGDLAFGESFGCLVEKKYNPWVRHIFKGIKDIAYMTNFGRIPWLARILKLFTPKSVSNKWAEHREISSEKVRKRLAMEYNRPDFVDSMVKKTKSAGADITFDELASNAQLIVLAGSETTATLLSAATYYLTTHPDILTKLNDEVRSAFTTEDEIDMISVSKLPYMLAILNESLRMFPPVVNGVPRLIGPGGDTIIGQYIHEGTTVDIWHWAVYRNPDHFAQPNDFIPERWLGDTRFNNDAKQALQPFSIGPRDCIGKNLAHAEMRLILARLAWNFDIRLAADSFDWESRCESYFLWQKGPVNVYLTPRV